MRPAIIATEAESILLADHCDNIRALASTQSDISGEIA
jgi:hypothetical protein